MAGEEKGDGGLFRTDLAGAFCLFFSLWHCGSACTCTCTCVACRPWCGAGSVAFFSRFACQRALHWTSIGERAKASVVRLPEGRGGQSGRRRLWRGVTVCTVPESVHVCMCFLCVCMTLWTVVAHEMSGGQWCHHPWVVYGLMAAPTGLFISNLKGWLVGCGGRV
jgi:hypothetical protein